MTYDKLCIIMADGKAKRMQGLNKKKQLIVIDGEPIICRTIRQLRKLGVEPVIATHFEDYDFLDIARIIPENNDHEIKKFSANKKYYEKYKETLFIWGDTYFEDKDIETIIKTPVESFKFFGTEFEIFGFKIKQPYYHLIDEGSDYIITHTELDYGNTGTWGLLRYIGGHKMEAVPKEVAKETGITSVHEPFKYAEEGLLYMLPGLSIDNDGMEDLVEFHNRFPNANVEELLFTKPDGSQLKFVNGEWIECSSK